MNVKDFRVGNIFYCGNCNVEIVMISKEKIKVKTIPHRNGASTLELTYEEKYFSHLKPISITSEMLLACGFIQNEHDKNLYKYKDFIYFKLEYEYNNSVNFDYISANLRGTNAGSFMCRLYYLHQLQNLYFALTNQELEFKPELK